MNRLEKLRADLLEEECCDDTIFTSDVVRIVNEFCAEYEVVEVAVGQISGRFYDPNDLSPHSEVTTILVPRKVPTLLEAAEGASAAWHESRLTTPALCDALLALDTAIRKERSR